MHLQKTLVLWKEFVPCCVSDKCTFLNCISTFIEVEEMTVMQSMSISIFYLFWVNICSTMCCCLSGGTSTSMSDPRRQSPCHCFTTFLWIKCSVVFSMARTVAHFAASYTPHRRGLPTRTLLTTKQTACLHEGSCSSSNNHGRLGFFKQIHPTCF